MKTLKGTQTEKNLLQSFLGECSARQRYDMFAKQAIKEGLEQIAAIFTETALNEVEHGKRFFRFLEGNKVEITASFSTEQVGDTLENLKIAAEGENEEGNELYPHFADIADEEGFPEIANTFRKIAEVEIAHNARYKKLYSNLEEGKVFKSDDKVIRKCRNCGYLHEATSAPTICPACLHPQSFFQIKENNY